MAKLRIRQSGSIIGATANQKRNLRALGLHKIDNTVVRGDTPIIRGMIAKVSHLVEVTPCEEEETPKAKPAKKAAPKAQEKKEPAKKAEKKEAPAKKPAKKSKPVEEKTEAEEK